MAKHRSTLSPKQQHNEVYRAVSSMRRDAGRLAERSLYEDWPAASISFLYRLYDVLAEFETQCRNLEDQGQLPL